MGKGFRLTARIVVPRSIGEVFEFFADAGNLDLLTPSWVRFHILTPMPVTMREGLLLDYRLRIRGIPVTWQSEITAWEPPNRFVDEQRRGPYRYWVHEHLFRPKGSDTEVIDRVDYAVLGGALVHRLFVKGDVSSIFRYRQQRLMQVFQAQPELKRPE